MEIEGARANNLSSEQLTANARAFCEVIAAAGYAPMLYGNQRDLLRLAPELRAAYPVWLAEYDVEATHRSARLLHLAVHQRRHGSRHPHRRRFECVA